MEEKSTRTWGEALAVAGTFLLWLLPSLGPIYKFTGTIGLAVIPVCALVGILLLERTDLAQHIARFKWWSVALAGFALLAFTILYPLANSGAFGGGSDRDDALNVALHSLLSGHSPYSANTYLGNPPTPMPGALFLALPFYLIGNSAFQNIAWACIFMWWCRNYFSDHAKALSYLLIFIFACPASLGDFVVGGDYLVNAIYVIIAMDIAIRSGSSSGLCRYLAYAFLAVAISSRPIYGLAIPIVSAVALQRNGVKSAIQSAGALILFYVAINLPFYLSDPSNFPFLRIEEKLAGIPLWLHAGTLIPVIGTVAACAGFFVKMSRARAIGLFAASLGSMLYPAAFLLALVYHFNQDTLFAFSATLPCSLLGALYLAGSINGKPSITQS